MQLTACYIVPIVSGSTASRASLCLVVEQLYQVRRWPHHLIRGVKPAAYRRWADGLSFIEVDPSVDATSLKVCRCPRVARLDLDRLGVIRHN